MPLTHLSLFSGIGGLDIAAEWAGFETVGQCEWADYPTKVLEKHWPDVPRWRDIRTLTQESFYERTGLRTVDIISGGFPCQPFSVAGKQKGKEDNRYLWPEMLRVIRELKPRWVVGENVPGILRIAAYDVATSLEREGFDVAVFDFEAAAVGAPHRRERIAFVGNAQHNGQPSDTQLRGNGQTSDRWGKKKPTAPLKSEGTGRPDDESGVCRSPGESEWAVADTVCNRGAAGLADSQRGEKRFTAKFVYGCAALGDSDGSGLQIPGHERNFKSTEPKNRAAYTGWWAVEPDVGRVAHGVPSRVDRLKCLGNAVVPQQFYPIFKAIYDVENNTI